MNKIWLVIKREYLTRVKNKTFLLSTFLFPLVLVLFIAGSIFLAVRNREKIKIAVSDKSNTLPAALKSDSSSVIFSFDNTADSTNYRDKKYAGILYLVNEKDNNYILISEKQIGFEAKETIREKLNNAAEARLLQEKGVDKSLLDSISREVAENKVKLVNKVKDKSGNTKEANSGLAYGIGFGSGILIYITMFIFGAMVMRGVMEEKTNRIAEVMVSSIKPFQLMMGKIIGIAAVGLTQFLLWIGLIIVLINVAGVFLPADALQQAQQLNEAQQNIPGGSNNTMALKIMQAKDSFVGGVNWLLILSCFIFYFLGGYLFYASLFAAIGSVINEDPQEAQSLMLPITMPIIFSFIILSTGISNPNSPAMVWGSMIPFSSPILMMGRIAYGVPEGVPVWQLLLSMILLVGGFIFTTWFAGKVYRTGILLYGKKASWKEMIKWIRKS